LQKGQICIATNLKLLHCLKCPLNVRWESGVKTNISIRNFPTFSMEEPTELGGIDTAPTPMEYVVTTLNGIMD
jgi:hypothetical protein